MQTITNKTITSANSVLLVRVKGAVDQWTRIQAFAADDAFTGGKGAMGVTMVGVDGHQAGGWTPYETQWDIALLANSPSRALFDTVINAQDRAQEIFMWEFKLELPSIRKTYGATGFLTEGDSITTGKKVLQSVSYSFKTIVNSREDI